MDLAQGRPAFGGQFDSVYLDPGRGPRTRLLRRDADWACPRRRPVCAGDLAAALDRDHRRLLRPPLLGGRSRRDPSVRRRRDFRCRSRPHGERGLCHLPPSGGGAAAPDGAASIRAGAVPRSDARLQGRGDAADLAADGPCAGQARPAHHHRGRDLGRHRRRRGRRVRGPRECRSHRAVPARPHLRGAAADDDDDGRRQRPCARHRGHISTIARRS